MYVVGEECKTLGTLRYLVCAYVERKVGEHRAEATQHECSQHESAATVAEQLYDKQQYAEPECIAETERKHTPERAVFQRRYVACISG